MKVFIGLSLVFFFLMTSVVYWKAKEEGERGKRYSLSAVPKKGKYSGVRVVHEATSIHFPKKYLTHSYYYEEGSFIIDFTDSALFYDSSSDRSFQFDKVTKALYEVSQGAVKSKYSRKGIKLGEENCSLGDEEWMCHLWSETFQIPIRAKKLEVLQLTSQAKIIPYHSFLSKKFNIDQYKKNLENLHGKDSILGRGIVLKGSTGYAQNLELGEDRFLIGNSDSLEDVLATYEIISITRFEGLELPIDLIDFKEKKGLCYILGPSVCEPHY